jgi:hypothetical protein
MRDFLAAGSTRPGSAIQQTGRQSSLSFGSKASHVSPVRRGGLCLKNEEAEGPADGMVIC